MSTSGIYLHIPFCSFRCGYCDFCVTTNLAIKEKYINSLCSEIDLYEQELSSFEINSIYFGGGTPSLLKYDEIYEIFSALKSKCNILTDCEITFEVNPEDIINSPHLPSSLKSFGVNRISLGVQSFIESELSFLERQHSNAQIPSVITNLKKYFSNISIDLIYSLPLYSSNYFQKTSPLYECNLDTNSGSFSSNSSVHKYLLSNLKEALNLNVNHISAYTLIPESDTKLFSKLRKTSLADYRLINSDSSNFLNNKFLSKYSNNIISQSNITTPECSDFLKQYSESMESEDYRLLSDFLTLNGYEHYEISNYSKPGFRSIHNLNYWEYGNYFGFGVSAHSFINCVRYRNTSNIVRYNTLLKSKTKPEISSKALTEKEMKTEYIMLALRSTGINFEKFKHKFNSDFEKIYSEAIKTLVKNGFANSNNSSFKLTETGYAVADEITARYF